MVVTSVADDCSGVVTVCSVATPPTTSTKTKKYTKALFRKAYSVKFIAFRVCSQQLTDIGSRNRRQRPHLLPVLQVMDACGNHDLSRLQIGFHQRETILMDLFHLNLPFLNRPVLFIEQPYIRLAFLLKQGGNRKHRKTSRPRTEADGHRDAHTCRQPLHCVLFQAKTDIEQLIVILTISKEKGQRTALISCLDYAVGAFAAYVPYLFKCGCKASLASSSFLRNLRALLCNLSRSARNEYVRLSVFIAYTIDTKKGAKRNSAL